MKIGGRSRNSRQRPERPASPENPESPESPENPENPESPAPHTQSNTIDKDKVNFKKNYGKEIYHL